MTTFRRWTQGFKRVLKSRLIGLRERWVRWALSFDAPELLAALRRAGIKDGDCVMLHSAFAPHHGFRGSITALTQVFIDAIGPRGHLLMVSLPYRGSSFDYLSRLRQFDQRHTPSMMGMISEYFRRRPDVVRSLHPTHPVLVYGPEAQWFVEGHERCLYPCGPGSPFDRLAQRNGLAAFLNVPFANFTFFHYLEHLVSPHLPFDLYTKQPLEAKVIDYQGRASTVTTYVYAADAIKRRRFEILEHELRERGVIAKSKIGNSVVETVRVRDAIDCVQDMNRRGVYFYDMTNG